MSLKRTADPTQDEELNKRLKMIEPEPSRALFFGNIDPTKVSYYDICKIANQYGALELVNIVAKRFCAFVNFVEPESAQALYAAAQQNSIMIMDKEIAIKWGKAKDITPELMAQIEAGATRNLFLAGIPPGITHSELHHAFSRFGDIENVVVISQKNIAFVNMVSVKAAVSALEYAQANGFEIRGAKLKMNYAKEGVPARDPRQIVETVPAQPYQGYPQHVQPRQYTTAQLRGGGGGAQVMDGNNMFAQDSNSASRAIFLGNVTANVTYQELCRLANRYGRLEQAKMNPDKQNAFLNFLDADAAMAMMEECRMRPTTLGGEKIKINWAKSTPLKQEAIVELQKGATRNLFVGGIHPTTTEEDLMSLFNPYTSGEYDSISILPEKTIAFVNMTSLKAAVMAKNGLQRDGPCVFQDNELKLAYAKESTQRVSPYNVFGTGGGPGTRVLTRATGQPAAQYVTHHPPALTQYQGRQQQQQSPGPAGFSGYNAPPGY